MVIIEALLMLLIIIVAAGMMFHALRWAITYFGIPPPVDKLLWGLVIIVAIVVIFRYVLGVGGERIVIL